MSGTFGFWFSSARGRFGLPRKRFFTGFTGMMLLWPLVFIAAVLPGCGGLAEDMAPGEDIALDVAACAATLLEEINFQDSLEAISDEMIAVIYQIPAGDVLEQRVYLSTGATAEEIAVFEAADTAAAQRIESAVWQRIADQKANFEDYLPAEMPRLEDPFIFVRGRYVVLCVSDHNEKAKAELGELLK